MQQEVPSGVSPATRKLLAEGRFGHVIDGEVRASLSGATMAVIDPATGREFARCATGGPEDVDAAARSARASFEDGRWRRTPAADKERVLQRFAQLLEDHRQVLGDLDVLDGGLLSGYSAFVVQFAIDSVRYYAGWPTKLHGRLPPVSTDLIVQEVREPIGVCGVITPWNGPSVSPASFVAALACGNSVVLKPAEQTPLTAVLAAQLAIEAGVPPGVVNVVQGAGETVGAAIVAHPDIDFINFTGSCATGRVIQAAAAGRLKPLGLELGGKSPQIVFGDARIDEAAASICGGIWGHSGQVCTAGSRVLVHRSVHDKLVDQVAEASRSLRLGSGFDPQAQIGPLISAEQLERVSAYVALGRSEGAKVVIGGERAGGEGFFHQPTIFQGVRNEMRIAQEEIFGPVMTVTSFDDDETAYRLANQTEFGLAAGVWTTDLDRAHRASQHLTAGTVWVNCYQLVTPSVPYGGMKQSGYGRNLGAASLDHYTHSKSVWIRLR